MPRKNRIRDDSENPKNRPNGMANGDPNATKGKGARGGSVFSNSNAPPTDGMDGTKPGSIMLVHRKKDRTPGSNDQGQQQEGHVLGDKTGLSKKKRSPREEYEMLKQAALSAQKIAEEAGEHLKKEIDSARKQHEKVDVEKGPKSLRDAARRLEEARDAYIEAVKAARQQRLAMGGWDRFINDIVEGVQNGGRVRVWT